MTDTSPRLQINELRANVGKGGTPMSTEQLTPSGKLDLSWTNKNRRLLGDDHGGYIWVPRHDYRVEEVRLLHDVGPYGQIATQRTDDSLLIRGDALHGLHSLSRLPEFANKYVGKIKLAYIDPPFNSNQAFKQYDDALEHSVWLTMMRDRVEQIRPLLSDKGSLWVHCDDGEHAYVKIVLDEVFGRKCFAGTIVWRSSDNSNNDEKMISTDHNYILVYGRQEHWRSNPRDPELWEVPHFRNPDNDPNGPWFDGNPVNSPKPRTNLRYTVTTPSGRTIQPPPNGWRWSKETLQSRIDSGEIRYSDDESRIIRRTYFKDHEGLPPSSLWGSVEDADETSSLWDDLTETGHNRQAKAEQRQLNKGVPAADLFPTPKPERLMQKIIEIASSAGDIVLDCFLGSGTTAAVAHKMDRRWVGIERELATVEDFTLPRLERVVLGTDKGGVTKALGWPGGGGFRVLEVAPSMYEESSGRVVLSDWVTNGRLTEVVAAQYEFDLQLDPPFAGRKGRTRLAVIDGLVDAQVVRLLLPQLGSDETLVLCGTAVDDNACHVLEASRPGSVVERIPEATLARYQRRHRATRRWERIGG